MIRKPLLKLGLSATVVAAAMAPAIPIGATPVETGCPTSSEPKTVDEWSGLGYVAPGFLDGNGDGVVCGRPMPAGYRWGRFEMALGFEPQVDVIYYFVDNDSPARSEAVPR